uniref:Uncharacterized protein n=1 Tax=Cacopsylla melanoneura TaxID=428564 RepID=A0A8D8ZGY2_9HEMI
MIALGTPSQIKLFNDPYRSLSILVSCMLVHSSFWYGLLCLDTNISFVFPKLTNSSVNNNKGMLYTLIFVKSLILFYFVRFSLVSNIIVNQNPLFLESRP